MPISNLETSRRKIAYDETAADLIEKNPKLLKRILDAKQSLNGRTGPRDLISEGINIHLIEDNIDQKYLKLSIQGKEYFIKFTPKELQAKYSGGVTEYKRLESAKEQIEKAGLENVRFVNFRFAYEDSKNTFFVSDYEPAAATNLANYIIVLEQSKSSTAKNQIIKLKDRAAKIKSVLPNFKDASERNLAYDPKTDQIVIFDL